MKIILDLKITDDHPAYQLGLILDRVRQMIENKTIGKVKFDTIAVKGSITVLDDPPPSSMALHS